MRIQFFAFLLLYAATSTAQVGVGVSGSVDASAKFQVDANNKGFLPPRVNLASTTDVTTIPSPATGLIVYNLAAAGTAPGNVTPGIYYYDGTRWQRAVNQLPDATVEFSVNADPNTVGTSFSGTAASKDYIYVSTIDNKQWVYDGTNYVSYNPPASTAWYTKGTTSDAGGNKTGGIYRTGNMGIGTGSMDPTTKLHIVSSTSGGGLRLVDGSQGANKVLQSDASGNASWSTNVAITPAVIGVRGAGNFNSGQNTNTGAYIDLPNGKWSVQVTMLAKATLSGTYWIRTLFVAESGAATLHIGPTQIGGLINGADSRYNMITGTVIINNNTGATKRYLYHTGTFDAWDGGDITNVRLQDFARDTWGENGIVAYPMN